MGPEPGSLELGVRLCKMTAGNGEFEGEVVGAVVCLLGSEHSHASPGGVQLPLERTRHCDHHISLQMHWASPAHISLELRSH